MTNKNKPKPPGNLARKTFKDDSGVPRVVFVPEHETDLRKGIPASLDLTPLFGHMPQAFQAAFYDALHAQGLIEADDFFQPDSAERYRRALFTVIKHDFLDIQALAKSEVDHVL